MVNGVVPRAAGGTDQLVSDASCGASRGRPARKECLVSWAQWVQWARKVQWVRWVVVAMLVLPVVLVILAYLDQLDPQAQQVLRDLLHRLCPSCRILGESNRGN